MDWILVGVIRNLWQQDVGRDTYPGREVRGLYSPPLRIPAGLDCFFRSFPSVLFGGLCFVGCRNLFGLVIPRALHEFEQKLFSSSSSRPF